MTGILRRQGDGYRTTHPVDCPHCARPVHIQAYVAEDRDGKHFKLLPLAPTPEYTAADLARVYGGPDATAAVTGVALPQPPHPRAGAGPTGIRGRLIP